MNLAQLVPPTPIPPATVAPPPVVIPYLEVPISTRSPDDLFALGMVTLGLLVLLVVILAVHAWDHLRSRSRTG